MKLLAQHLLRRWLRVATGTVTCALALIVAGAITAVAADAKALSAQLSDEAFALLTSISGKHDTPSPLLGPVGVFAADSQKLSSAVQAQDHRGAGAAMAALESDAAAIDKAGSKGLDAAKWRDIKRDLASLSTMVPAAPAASVASAPEHSTRSAAPSEESAPASALPSAEAGESGDNPRVRIDSAQMVGADALRVKGYMSGRSLRSAGIYMGETRLAKLDIKRVSGQQMIQFNIEIHNPEQGSVLRVYDAEGRSAQAPILGGVAEAAAPAPESGPAAAAAPPRASPSSPNVALGGGLDESSELERMEGALESASRSDSSASGPGVWENNPSENSAPGANTEEIPSAAPPPSGPKSRMESHLAPHGNNDIQIQIEGLTVVDPGMREYMVKGQIAGSNLKRAGIYVDGRLVQKLPVERGSGFHTSSFAQSFTAVGSEATIRVYRSRRNYSETSINLASASTGTTSMPPAMLGSAIGSAYPGAINPGQLGVQITSVQAAAPSLYVVSGTITGRNIASAGIYQNGALTQPLSIGSGGVAAAIGGLISGLIPGMGKQYSFVGRFNPALGYATVRAYDSSGMMAEEPVMSGGSPYGYGVNPYGVNPYGVNPYGVNPYVRNPYSTNPYSTSPYAVSPFGSPGIGLAPGVGASPRRGVGVGTAPW